MARLLPPLRQELALHVGPASHDGTPTWTLHDPCANRFYRLTWLAFELLSRWALGSAQDVVEAVNRDTTLTVGEADMNDLLQMLQHNHLLISSSAADTRRLVAEAHAARLSLARWLLQNYLFFRLPLVRPERFLRRVAPWVRWAYLPGFWGGILVTALLGWVLAARHWDEFTHTFVSYADWQGAGFIAAALSLAKVLHELGHAFTAQRYGCRVPSMGVAFLVMWPVLYTDTNDAWKLTSRRQRLAIGAAGMLSEIALAAVATLAWSLLPNGPLRSGAFLLATSTWLLTLAINASPFMRFDGYFLLSDALNLPNLHERAFAQGRWWLRERLFGWGEDAPETFTATRRGFLIVFAIATWLYRLVLFFGIALLVYHLFFKTLGLVLMAVELGWFIARPVWRELSAWWRRRDQMRWNRASSRTASVLVMALFALLWPWQTTISAPAVLGALRSQAVYVPYAAQVTARLPTPGQAVRAGEPLAQLRSPELMSRLAQARAREEQLRWQLSQQPFDEKLMEAGPALRRHWESSLEEVEGLARELQRLLPVAPFDGTVADVAEDVGPGTWLAAGERLMRVIGPVGAKVDAYVDEAALQSVAQAQSAVFIPHAPEGRRVVCNNLWVDAVQLTQLEQPSVASTHGGEVTTQSLPGGRLVPLQPTFRVRLEECDLGPAPKVEVTGVALLKGERVAWMVKAIRWMGALWWREGMG